MKFLFFFCLSIVLLTYAVYPLWLAFLSLLFSRRPRSAATHPFISLFLLDEMGTVPVEENVASLLALDYPRERLEIFLGIDGAPEATYRAVKKLAEEKNIRYAVSFQRLGRNAMINKLSRDARGEIFVFFDARHKIERQFLKTLIAPFADGDVGYVGAGLETLGAPGVSFGFSNVWEKTLRVLENATASMLVPTGAAYALRRELFKYLPKDGAVFADDAYALMNVVAADRRAVMEPLAQTSVLAEGRLPQQAWEGLVRERLGDMQLFSLFSEVALSLKNRMALRFLAHKVLPLTTPYVFAALLGANITLLGRGEFFLWFFFGQVVFYGMALLVVLTGKSGIGRGVVSWPYEFCLSQVAVVLASRLFFSGQHVLAWEE